MIPDTMTIIDNDELEKLRKYAMLYKELTKEKPIYNEVVVSGKYTGSYSTGIIR